MAHLHVMENNGTSTCDGEQMRQIVLQSIHNCRSYGPDKFRWTDAVMPANTPNCHDQYVSLSASGLDNNDLQNYTKT